LHPKLSEVKMLIGNDPPALAGELQTQGIAEITETDIDPPVISAGSEHNALEERDGKLFLWPRRPR
jgi:hypothetical protein